MINDFAGVVLFQVHIESPHSHRACQRHVQLGILLTAKGLGRVVPGRKHFLRGADARLAGIHVAGERVENLPGLAQIIGGPASKFLRPAIHRRRAGERIDDLHVLRSHESLAQGRIQGLCAITPGRSDADLMRCQPSLQFAADLRYVIHHFGGQALLARQGHEPLQMLQCQRDLVQRGIPLPDDLFRIDVLRVQPLGFFEFFHRPFPVALFGVGIPQVGMNARIGWIELPCRVPKGNCVI